jgi:NhaA family Na+:H+ antiporter
VPGSLVGRKAAVSPNPPERRDDLLTVALLAAATAVALVWANSPWREAYESLVHLGSGVDTGVTRLHLDLQAVVDDGLMAIFFLSVGLEIKRELVVGELRDPRVATLPALAALGGMVVPAAIYALINAGAPGSGGWGVPMATDIAFALGVIALLGPRIPSSVRLFLLTLAVVDDVGAIVVIAIWYSGTVSLGWLAGAAAVAVAIWLAHRRARHGTSLHVVLGLALWYCTFRSGIHPTIAGVVAGLLAPVTGAGVAPRWERRLAPFVGFVVVPLFALVNAGVRIEPGVLDGHGSRLVVVGVVGGLVAGKFVGVVGASWLTVRFTRFELPAAMSWRHLAGVGALAGMGFTVSLFVAGLAFADRSTLEDAAKLGILAATAIAGVSGAIGLGTVDGRARARRVGEDLR